MNRLPALLILLGLGGVLVKSADPDTARLWLGGSFALFGSALACVVLGAYIRTYRAERARLEEAKDGCLHDAAIISNWTGLPLSDVMDALLKARKFL